MCHLNCRYDYISVVLPYEAMLQKIQPRQHCAWFKALLILNLLQECFSSFTRDTSAPEYLPLSRPQTPVSSTHTPASSTTTSSSGILHSKDDHRKSHVTEGITYTAATTTGNIRDEGEKIGTESVSAVDNSKSRFSNYKYLLWIDADAAVINPKKSVQTFLQQAQMMPACDLWISEDMGGDEGGSMCCPVNTGRVLGLV